MVLLVKRVHVDSLSNCELIIGEARFVHQQHVALILEKTPRLVSQPALTVFSLYVFLFQFGSAAAFRSTGRSSGERESWGDF